ncbi:hypothetical protein ARZXY2_3580 [Arthrobacter sp. ZXY-2]|nr:hypothetical protein ARZXY2_3580 [Arthrobacter sp. ZXY-2]
MFKATPDDKHPVLPLGSRVLMGRANCGFQLFVYFSRLIDSNFGKNLHWGPS